MKKLIVSLSLATMLSATYSCQQSAGTTEPNPLLSESPLEFGAPQFDKIRPEHYMPAFEAGMQQHKEEIEAIVKNPETPTFDNTIVALQRAGQLLSRTSGCFFPVASAHGTEPIREIEERIGPMLSAHYDAVNLNEALFARVKQVYTEQMSQLQGEDARLLQMVYDGFVKNGADLEPEAKEQLKKINEELSVLTNKFSNQVREASAKASILVEHADELSGLSEASLAQAKHDAEQAGHSGKYLLTNSNTTRSAYLSELDNRELRRRLLEASLTRAEQGDDNDTRAIVLQITRLRADKAKLLGFDNYATWGLKDQMASNPDNVDGFIYRLAKAYAPKAKADAKELEDFAKKTAGADFKLEAWDWDYYAEKLRKAKYDLDENDIKPYMALDSVLKNGVFYMAKQLYGISFVERTDLPVYAEHVHVYDVFDKNGKKMALFYTDYYRRPTKNGGAWMGNFVEQSHLLGNRPVVYNVCNYAPPVGDMPSLLNMDEVTTLFHEFGHGLHGLFANQQYETLSGTNVPRDFVEMPSQFHEHWATDPAVLGNYAKHYKSGEAMPEALVEKMKRAARFNQAYALGENIASVVIDMAWHKLPAGSEVKDVAAFEREALERAGIYNKQIPPRYRSTYFRHSMGGGYSAGYYAYLWSEVLDNNVYDWFVKNGGLTPENGERLRELILSKGNSQDLNGLFQQMTGLKHPDISSLMRARGLQ